MVNYQEFLNTILAELDELPVYISENTKEFYDSYYLDALENSLSEEDIIKQLGDPISIASQIKLDYYLYQPKKAGKVFRNLFKNVFSRKAALSTGKFIGGIVSYIFAIILYIFQLVLKLSSIGIIGGGLYQIYITYGVVFNPQVVMILATVLLAFAFLMLASLLFEWLSFLLRKLTINLMRKEGDSVKKPRTKKFKPVLIVYGVLLVIGILGLLTSPVYHSLTNIWLSNEPTNYIVVEEDFDYIDIDYILLDVQHVNINITYDDVDSIQLYYEKASYFDLNFSTHEGVLRIQEVGNGEIPYLEFFTRHEGTLDLNLVLPEDLVLEELKIVSIGSNMEIEVMNADLDIDTNTSTVIVNYIGDYDLFIDTERGSVSVGNSEGPDYELDESNQYNININGVTTLVTINKITE